MWTKKDRLYAVLNGEHADRPPITCYHHFPKYEHDGAELLANTLWDFQNKFDWDFIKINSRATYYNEAWGNTYDFSIYQGVNPTLLTHVIDSLDGLDSINEQNAGEGVWKEHLDLAKILVEKSNGEIPVFPSIFTPSSILLTLCGFDTVGRYRKAIREESPIIKFCHENPEMVHKALKNIAFTLASYNEQLKNIGVDGVFYAELGMARTGYFTEEEWNEFVKPYDMIALEPIKDLQNIIHTCGIYGNPEWFTDYPCKVIHWAESAPGNPTLLGSEKWLKGKIPMGGCDERPFGAGTPDVIDSLCKKTLQQMKNIPFVFAPECSVDPKTPDEDIQIFRDSVEKYY